MKDKRIVYCEYKFWERFFLLEQQDDFIRDRKKRRVWDDFFQFLENSVLYFDKRQHEIDKNSAGGNELMKFFQQRGGANIYFLSTDFPDIEKVSNNDNEYLNSVFLRDDETETCIKLSQKTGIFVFNLDMALMAEHVYRNNGECFTKNNGKNWSYMMDLKKKCPSISSCNSLIIVDRYFLADMNDNTLDNNLRPILDALLPEKLDKDICFNICIMAENLCANINEKLSRIRNLILDIRKDLKFSLNLYDSKGIHDRSILTNNIFLTVGAGFCIIGRDSTPLKFTTTTLIFPFLEGNDKDNICYLEWLKRILQEEERCKRKKNNLFGDKDTRHHLLDYYYVEPQLPRSTFTLGENASLLSLKAALESGSFIQ